MASLITDAEKTALSGVFDDIFDTFKQNITIHKEPIKTVSSINESNIFGYGDSSNQVNYTYSAQTGVYPAIIRYTDNQSQDYYSDLNGAIPKGDARIKIKKDCRDFIENGKTERVEFDDKVWNVVSTDSVRKFLDSHYYVYYLERVK